MESVLTNTGFTVIVESIGTASPVISKILAESFGIPQEMIVRKLYNAPAVLFEQVDDSVAHKAQEVLTTLGLQVRVQPVGQPLPAMPEPMEVAVHLPDASALPRVAAQLAEFLGCTPKDALSLLLNEPSVVLGGVSASTAEALAQRLEAEVLLSNPRKDLYTLELLTADNALVQNMRHALQQAGITHDFKKSLLVRNLDYKTSQDIWRRHHSNGNLHIRNQAFERYEVILVDASARNDAHRQVLEEQAGMPSEVVDEVLAQLPVQLHESVAGGEAAELITRYQQAGLVCEAHLVPASRMQVILEEMPDKALAHQALKGVIEDAALPSKAPWQLPSPVPRLLARYILTQLEAAGCSAELREVADGR